MEIVIHKDGDWWVAICGDVVSQAKSPEDAAYEIQRMVVGQAVLEGRPIPEELRDRWHLSEEEKP